MKLICGLGNPGKEYDKTKHNLGFMVLDTYLGDIKWSKKNNALYYQTNNNGEQIIFVKPLTYMNLSGESVKKFVDFYKIDIMDILVIHDDLDLPFGKLRIKFDSKDGGHNGVKSIISLLQDTKFYRLKIGISSITNLETKDFVLSKLSKTEELCIKDLQEQCNTIIQMFITNEMPKAMNIFN